METDVKASEQTREIANIGMLDLTGMAARADLANITEIRNVGVMIVPETLMDKVMNIPMVHVGTVIPVPDGTRTRVISGEVTMSGEALAASQSEGEVLVVAGQLTFTTPVTASTQRLVVAGQVLAPEGSETGLGAAILRMSGEVAYYPYSEEGRVRFINGSTRLQGEWLANATGSEQDILVVNGQLFITSPVKRVGYARIYLAGQMVAPRESQAVLEPYLDVHGQVFYYAGTPRFFQSNQRFSREFFELLDGPIALVLPWGRHELEPDVTKEVLRDKVSEIVLGGKLKAPKALLPILQILAVENSGQILTEDDEDA